MKYLLLTVTFFVCSFGQAQSPNSNEFGYKSWVYLNSKAKPAKGALLEIRDSTVLIVDKSSMFRNKIVPGFVAQTIPVTSITRIKVRKKNKVSKGFFIGTLSGALAGAIVGYASGDDYCPPNQYCMITFSAEDNALLGATLGAIPGSILGTLIGRQKKTISIKGNQQLYTDVREELQSYSLNQKQEINSSQ